MEGDRPTWVDAAQKFAALGYSFSESKTVINSMPQITTNSHRLSHRQSLFPQSHNEPQQPRRRQRHIEQRTGRTQTTLKRVQHERAVTRHSCRLAASPRADACTPAARTCFSSGATDHITNDVHGRVARCGHTHQRVLRPLHRISDRVTRGEKQTLQH